MEDEAAVWRVRPQNHTISQSNTQVKRQRHRFLQFQYALYNTPVQGTAADITKKALSLLPQRLEDTGAKIIGTVHDEIILEVRNEMAREAAVILEETMIQAGKVYLGKVPVEVEIAIRLKNHFGTEVAKAAA